MIPQAQENKMNADETMQYRSWVEVDLGSFNANWLELTRTLK
jgi:hypothetical protein